MSLELRLPKIVIALDEALCHRGKTTCPF